ncbi:MAG: cell division protein ZapA [Betaproteobacteria bacterium]|jgi:cell division protein ZapA|nr:cell division protein ZapA [Betaproteobacteria bacterium]
MPSPKAPKAEELEVAIMDRGYRLACPPEEKPLLMECVAMVDTRMRQIKQNSRLQGSDRIAVMAALTLARELLTLPGRNTAPGLDHDGLQQALTALIEQADQALAPQEKLFD